jgi:NAD(P)H-dependent FMN reductase
MTKKPRIAVIIGSTRSGRFADKPANWVLEKAKARNWDVELVDIRDYDLPFFDEAASNRWMPSASKNAANWQKKIASFDGYLFIVAEYNRSITGALKNAIDQASADFVHKPMAALGYGATGGARAVEHLRSIAIELEMVPVRSAIHIMGADFMKVHPMGGTDAPMSEIDATVGPSVESTFNDLDWWVSATLAARAANGQSKAA